jgi:hypothetical protein
LIDIAFWIQGIKDDACKKSFVCLLDLDSLERISIAAHNISLNIEEAQLSYAATIGIVTLVCPDEV